jgi:class 3 adenylate cyclase
VTLNGDYFGNAVNLAARLVAAAAPGQILVSADLRAQLPDWPAVEQEPLQLKGFGAPVVAYELGRSG